MPRTPLGACGVVVLCVLGCGGAGDPDEPAPSTSGARASSSGSAAVALVDVTEARGLDVDLARTDGSTWFMPDSMAGGCALVDVDDDGDLDLFSVHGVWADGQASDDGLGRLWIQQSDGTFEDRSAESGVIGPHYGMGVAVGDATGDGLPDLYVTCFGPDQFLENLGDGRFRRVGLASERVGTWGASVTFCDLDADGALDVAVANYVDYPPGFADETRNAPTDYPAPNNFDGTLDVVLFGDGTGTFVDRSAELGIDVPGRGLGIAAGDWNGDGRCDLFVANDGEANHCWVQTADGRFEERALHLGLALSGTGSAEAGMGVARGDVSGDGAEDLLLTHLVQETHTLYTSKRTEDGIGYRDQTTRAGISGPSIDMTGFGTVLIDLDLDGALDLVAVHGRVLAGPVDPSANEMAHWRPYAERDMVLLGAAGRFRQVPAGDFDAAPETSRGLSAGDVDGDGDLDLVVTTAAGAVRLFEMSGAPTAHWLGVRAIESGRDALGAEVHVTADGRVQSRVVQTAHGYLSASEPVARFGLGDVDVVEDVLVRWTDGTAERFDGRGSSGGLDGRVDTVWIVRRGEGDVIR